MVVQVCVQVCLGHNHILTQKEYDYTTEIYTSLTYIYIICVHNLNFVFVGSSIQYHKIQKHFQNVLLVGMASEISKKYTLHTVLVTSCLQPYLYTFIYKLY